MTADIESMAELVQWGLLQFVSAMLLVVFVLVLLLALSWQLTIVGLLVMPVILVASRKFQRDSNAAYLEVRERVGPRGDRDGNTGAGGGQRDEACCARASAMAGTLRSRSNTL